MHTQLNAGWSEFAGKNIGVCLAQDRSYRRHDGRRHPRPPGGGQARSGNHNSISL